MRDYLLEPAMSSTLAEESKRERLQQQHPEETQGTMTNSDSVFFFCFLFLISWHVVPLVRIQISISVLDGILSAQFLNL